MSNARHGRVRRVLRYVLFSLAGSAVLFLVGAVAMWHYADSKLQDMEVPALEENRTDPDAPHDVIDGVLSVLLVGSDSREGLTHEQLQVLGTNDLGTNLTDTIMLVQISPTREEAVVVSFPRDLRVDPPGDLNAVKINSIRARGGVDLLVRTVQDLTGVPIDHYAQINIAGFMDVASVIGGVEICLDAPLRDVDERGRNFTGLDLSAGCHVLDEVTATRFVRARHADSEQFGHGDFGRIGRQQYFISQAMEKVTSMGTLSNPFGFKPLIDAVTSSVITDDELGMATMYRLASSLKDLDGAEAEATIVPSYWSNETGFVETHVQEAEELFQSLRERAGVNH